MTTLEPKEQAAFPVRVTAVRREGTVTLGYGTDESGHPILFAGDPRMLADIADHLADGPVTVAVEPWRIVAAGGDRA
jgi:hypothetical protein